jgi:hypothetical protein
MADDEGYADASEMTAIDTTTEQLPPPPADVLRQGPAGSEEGVLVQDLNKNDFKWASVWKTLIQSLIGTLEAMLIAAYVMTWAYMFSSDTFSLYLSLMQITLIPAVIFSLIVIPVMYGQMFEEGKLKIDELKVAKRGIKGSKLLLGYIIIEGVGFLSAAANVVTRAQMRFPLSLDPTIRMLNLSLFILTCIVIVTSIGGLIFGLALRSRLISLSTLREGQFTGRVVMDGQGKRRKVISMAKGSVKHGAREDAYKYAPKRMPVVTNAACKEYNQREEDLTSPSRDFVNVNLSDLRDDDIYY